MRIAMSGLSSFIYGGQAYFKNIILALSQIDKINEYHIFVSRNNFLVRTINQKNFIFYECSFNVSSGSKRFFWEQIRFPIILKKKKIDILFSVKNINVLAAPCKTVISIQNVLPFYYKNYQNHWKINLRSWMQLQLTKISLKKANRIIATSEATRDCLKHFFPRIDEKVDVIYYGNSFKDSSFAQKNFNIENDFLLSSSKFISYANQLNLIKAYVLLNQKVEDLPPLYLVGGISDPLYFRKIKKLISNKNLTKKIKVLGLIPRERLMELYAKALIFIFPSKLEACPHTLIEAMTCGAPIATVNVPPMPEISDKAALYFNPDNPDDIADKILQILQNNSLRQQLKMASVERSKYFSWEKTSRQVLEVFKKVFNQ